MRLLKLKVEEGFMHGLDLDFHAGLNVLIGPRGAGKTSVIELIRFCLGAEAYTPANDRAARDHAISILRGGQVSLTIEIDSGVYELIRSSDDDPPARPEGLEAPPIVLSQNEIERIGLNARGRVRLLDDFISEEAPIRVEEGRLQADISSLTQKIQSEAEVVTRFEEEILSFGALDDELAEAKRAQDEILQGFSELEPQRDELASIDSELLILGNRRELLSEADDSIEAFLREVKELASETDQLLPDWPAKGAGDDELAEVRDKARAVAEHLVAARDAGEEAQRAIQKRLNDLTRKHKSARDRGRSLRSTLEEVQSGAGEASRRVTQLSEEKGSREAANKKLKAAQKSLKALQTKRKAYLKELDTLRKARFDARHSVASELNKRLGPQVKVAVSRYGVLDQYSESIADALQGSRLRYNTLAPQIAERMTPAELVEAVEQGKAAAISNAVQITEERAERIIEALRQAGSEGILKAEIEDAVGITLLDGADYKSSTELSTGQRCTAVLPILLSHSDRPLVMDQPEDHLDNAYVADTVVRTLREAPASAQLVISTHNANIPVLGEADRVIHLESDGQRGFVKSSAPLDDPESVSAITRVMEGGDEAFRARAEFYQEHESGD